MGTAPKDPKVIASPKGRGNPYASKQGKFGFLRRRLLAMTKKRHGNGDRPLLIYVQKNPPAACNRKTVRRTKL